jgi:hypothetical protein
VSGEAIASQGDRVGMTVDMITEAIARRKDTSNAEAK